MAQRLNWLCKIDTGLFFWKKKMARKRFEQPSHIISLVQVGINMKSIHFYIILFFIYLLWTVYFLYLVTPLENQLLYLPSGGISLPIYYYIYKGKLACITAVYIVKTSASSHVRVAPKYYVCPNIEKDQGEISVQL